MSPIPPALLTWALGAGAALAAGLPDAAALPPDAAPPPDDAAALARMQADVAWMVEALGPRPAGGEAEAKAAAGVAARLDAAGWRPEVVGCPLCVVACRGAGRRLFLAHLDSVPGTAGAVDNAAGVAALLELARSTSSEDLCLGFPAAEEAGLLGSAAMAAAWPAPLPELVVALDLTGHGRLSVTGLGPRWGGADLRWLREHAPVDSPYAYRVVSRALPGMERSDHRPFADRGARALHLLGRGPGGVFDRYHQPDDDHVEAPALAELLAALQGLARAPLPQGRPDAAATVGPLVLPAWATWSVLAAALLLGLHDLLRPARGRPVLDPLLDLGRALLRCLLASLVAGIALAAATRAGAFTPTRGELTAAQVMGLPASGWWTGALPGLAAGWLAWLLLRWRLGGRGSPTLPAALLAALALRVDPLLALPFAAAGLLARAHPLLGALPALYLLWPDKLRELAFHGLLPPAAWGALWLLTWPAFGSYARRARRDPR
ncbi:M28 family metallopeptidase [Myxococcota bacterium]|nr:M28 family metallopeptidase [Myxococcota bacterium]